MLSNEDIARLDDRYVMQENCDTKHRAVTDRQNKTDMTVAVQGTQLATLIKVLLIVGTPTAAALVAIAIKVIFGG